MLLLKNMHTDLRTLKVVACEAQWLSQTDSNCCRPAEDKLTNSKMVIDISEVIYTLTTKWATYCRCI